MLVPAGRLQGGETSFPEQSAWAHPDMAEKYGSKFSDCAKVGVGSPPSHPITQAHQSLQHRASVMRFLQQASLS
jgi:hypothetical protein